MGKDDNETNHFLPTGMQVSIMTPKQMKSVDFSNLIYCWHSRIVEYAVSWFMQLRVTVGLHSCQGSAGVIPPTRAIRQNASFLFS